MFGEPEVWQTLLWVEQDGEPHQLAPIPVVPSGVCWMCLEMAAVRDHSVPIAVSPFDMHLGHSSHCQEDLKLPCWAKEVHSGCSLSESRRREW